MDCKTLNKSLYDKIESVLESKEHEKKYEQETFFKSIYSPATLINDWAEKRTTNEEITTPSEPLVSEQMDKYRPFCFNDCPDRSTYFNKIFDSYGYGQELLIDHLGFSYYGNYVSSYDLCYNHLPKGICGPMPRKYYKGKYEPETDLLKIYVKLRKANHHFQGNLTQWGLKEKIYRQTDVPVCRELPIPETQAQFIEYDMNEVKKLNDFKRFNKTKIVL